MLTQIRSLIRARTSRLMLAALPFTLVACGQGAGNAPAEVEPARTSAALTVSAAPTPAAQQAAGAQLFVQAPFVWDSGDFDLDMVDDINDDPVLTQRLDIPYDSVESELKNKLDALTQDPLLAGELEAPDGSHVLWTVTLSASARFSQRGQPRLTPWGDAAANGVHAELDTQLEVNLNAHIHVHATSPIVPDPDDVDVPLHALIGGHARADLAFFPVIRADGLEAWATLDQSDVDIVGLDGTAIGAGAVIGAGIGIVTGGSVITDALLGAITGEATLDLAKEKAKDIILDKAGQAFASSHDKLTAVINKAVQPAITGANDVLARLRSMPLPGTGQTLGQLEDQLGMSLDVRSATRDDIFRTVFTARFAAVPAGGVMSGRLRFPKRRCEYGVVGQELIGEFLRPYAVVDANQQLAATGCNAPEVAQLVHRAFHGLSPERVLQTGAPENDLPTWAPLGDVQMGEMQQTDDSYDCPFTLTGLPRAAFMELLAEDGSSLAGELSNRHLSDGQDGAYESRLHAGEKLGGRFVLLEQDGVSVVLTHDASAVATLDIGGPAPTVPGDCPLIQLSSGGGQAQVDPRDGIPDGENCPQCGGGQQQPGAEVSNPAVDQSGDPSAQQSAAVVAEDPAAAEAAVDNGAAAAAIDNGAAAAAIDNGAAAVAVDNGAAAAVIDNGAAAAAPTAATSQSAAASASTGDTHGSITAGSENARAYVGATSSVSSATRVSAAAAAARMASAQRLMLR